MQGHLYHFIYYKHPDADQTQWIGNNNVWVIGMHNPQNTDPIFHEIRAGRTFAPLRLIHFFGINDTNELWHCARKVSGDGAWLGWTNVFWHDFRINPIHSKAVCCYGTGNDVDICILTIQGTAMHGRLHTPHPFQGKFDWMEFQSIPGAEGFDEIACVRRGFTRDLIVTLTKEKRISTLIRKSYSHVWDSPSFEWKWLGQEGRIIAGAVRSNTELELIKDVSNFAAIATGYTICLRSVPQFALACTAGALAGFTAVAISAHQKVRDTESELEFSEEGVDFTPPVLDNINVDDTEEGED